jgi:hypothetical protein
MKTSIVYLALLGSACAASCTSDHDDLVGEASQDMISVNGTSLSGIALAGTASSGSTLDGSTLAGVSTSGTSQSGTAVTASSSTMAPLSGAGVVGSKWTGSASTGAQVALRIDSAQQGAAPNADLWFYAVSYQTTSGWRPLCGLDGAGQPIRAVAVAGVWSSIVGDSASYGASTTRFTLACKGKTIAKCVELGYKTYKGHANQMASCVRMLRGDYCGTGVAYTVDGTSLNLYDNVGVQSDTQAWPAEAEWTPAGARCVNSTNAARYELARARDPNCVKPLKTTTCGSSFANGALLIDELPAN